MVALALRFKSEVPELFVTNNNNDIFVGVLSRFLSFHNSFGGPGRRNYLEYFILIQYVQFCYSDSKTVYLDLTNLYACEE